MHDRLLRPAMVAVSKKTQKTNEEENWPILQLFKKESLMQAEGQQLEH